MHSREEQVAERYQLSFNEKAYGGRAYLSMVLGVATLAAALAVSAFKLEQTSDLFLISVLLVLSCACILHLGYTNNKAADTLAHRRYLIGHLDSERDDLIVLLSECDEKSIRKVLEVRAVRAGATRHIVEKEAEQLRKLGVESDIYSRSQMICEAETEYSRAAALLKEAGFYFPDVSEEFLKQKSAKIH